MEAWCKTGHGEELQVIIESDSQVGRDANMAS
jgi:hypothetical protein